MRIHIGGGIGRNALFVVTIAFFGLPIVWLLIAPTKSINQLTFMNPMAFGSVGHIRIALRNLLSFDHAIFWRWMLNSVWYTIVTLVGALLSSVPAGYALAKFNFRGRSEILFVTLITMLIPGAALILPLYLEMSAVGLTDTPWSVILPLMFYPFGVYMTYLFAKHSIPDSVLEAGRLDGCSEFGLFTLIFVPLSRPTIVMIGFFSVVGSWNSFFLPYIMLTSQHLANLQTGLQILVTSTGAIGGGNLTNIPIRAPEVALAAIVSIFPILLVFLFAQRYLAAGQAAGAEKG